MIRQFSLPLPARSLLPTLLLLLALGCQGRSEETSPSFILKGTLVYEDGEPVANAQVFVFMEGNFGLLLRGDSGGWANPSGSANSAGRFEIVVNRAFLPDSGRFLLGANLGGRVSPIVTAEGIMILFSVDPADDTLDLDRAMGSVKVQRAGQGI